MAPAFGLGTLRARAVRMVAGLAPDYPSQYAAITAVAKKLGIGTAETLRKWVRRAEVDAGQRPGMTSAEHAEIKRLKRENAELRPHRQTVGQRAEERVIDRIGQQLYLVCADTIGNDLFLDASRYSQNNGGASGAGSRQHSASTSSCTTRC